jgi:hypothetical protein
MLQLSRGPQCSLCRENIELTWRHKRHTRATSHLVQGRPSCLWQAVEKVTLLTLPTLARQDAPLPMLRSRIVQTLNVPQRVRLGPSLAAALLDSLFEQPAVFPGIAMSWPTAGAR